MGFLEWSSNYNIGVPELDEQHQKWLEMLNRFYDHVSDGHLNEKLKTLVEEAVQYTDFHFSSEEKLMRSLNYPKLEEQHRLHEEIRKSLRTIQNDINQNKFMISTIVTRQLKSWFNDHILKEDQQIANFIKSRK